MRLQSGDNYSTSLRLTPPTLEMSINLYKEMLLRVLHTVIFLEYLEEGVSSMEPGKSQKEGQEDQGTLKQLGGVPPNSFTSP